jgi:hypothetical protein
MPYTTEGDLPLEPVGSLDIEFSDQMMGLVGYQSYNLRLRIVGFAICKELAISYCDHSTN